MTDPTPLPPVTPQWAPPPPAYGYGAYGPPMHRRTNGLAIAAMVTAIVGVATICGYGIGSILLGPVGAIMGHVARRQIRERDEAGGGMALTGIIVGWFSLALGIVAFIGFFFLLRWAANLPPEYYETE